MLESLITEELTDVRVIFLLHVGLVVLGVGPGAGLFDPVFFQPMVEVMV